MFAQPMTASGTDPAQSAADAFYAFGYEMAAQERWSDASDVFRAMLLVCPSDERSWLGLGRCHDELGQSAVAVEIYSLCIVAIPSAVRARVALARQLRNTNRDAHAEQVLDVAGEIAESLEDDALLALVARARNES